MSASQQKNTKSYREELFFIISLKTVFENLNLVKRDNKTNLNILYLVYWTNIGGA